jgi:hypothetical protein
MLEGVVAEYNKEYFLFVTAVKTVIEINVTDLMTMIVIP